jgi:hypothetical protein
MQIFDRNKFYIKENLAEKLTYKDQGLKAYKKMDNSNFPTKKIIERDRQFAENWHNEHGNDLFDYNKRKLVFSNKTLKSHLQEKHITDGAAGRQNTIELIPGIIKNPNEVYMFEEGRNKRTKLRYIKYYKDFVMSVVSEFTENEIILQSWYNADMNNERNIRTGILIKKAFKH